MAYKLAMKVRLVAAMICQLLLLEAHGDDGVGQWMTGGDTTRTEEMMVEVDEKQQEVIDQGLALGKFLGTLLVDTLAVLPKVEVGLLTGDVELIQTALHGSETHRKIFEMVSEVLTQTTEDLTGENRTPGQKGYVIGKIVYEVASFLLPFTKAGTLMQVTKSQVLGKLIGKTGLLRPGAHNVATLTKAALDVTQMCFVAGTLVKTKSGLMKIEEVQVGMWVWSRDEFTQQEGWKQVRQTFITHPSVLYRLTYELRGPPQSHLLSTRSVFSSTSETLGVTAPHPFWVNNREKPGFVAAEELQVGDELFVDDERQAVVTGKTLELSPSDESFTTYNFEVGDFHTYFVGESSVWVHNHGVASCMLARSTIEAMVLRGEATWDAFRGTLTKVSPGEIGSRTRLKIFNETRQKYLTNAQWHTGTPPWEDLSRQLRGLGPVGSNSYWDQINGAAGNPKLLGNNLKATGIEAPWGGADGSLAAHHIVAAGEQYPSAVATRKILADAGIDVNEASNGVFLPRNAVDNDLGKAIHSGRHSEAYSVAIRDRLLPFAGDAPALRKELQKIADHLVNVGWLP